ncbi:hypothetical protein PspLS_11860 [Pyricularia sp. CBS 133598]|nr:hypothetical protein PspLS_11860 [Pyricularia sp. CBS 133598]
MARISALTQYMTPSVLIRKMRRHWSSSMDRNLIRNARHVGRAVEASGFCDNALDPLINLQTVADVDFIEIELGVFVDFT